MRFEELKVGDKFIFDFGIENEEVIAGIKKITKIKH